MAGTRNVFSQVPRLEKAGLHCWVSFGHRAGGKPTSNLLASRLGPTGGAPPVGLFGRLGGLAAPSASPGGLLIVCSYAWLMLSFLVPHVPTPPSLPF